jgi:hypothetical protein
MASSYGGGVIGGAASESAFKQRMAETVVPGRGLNPAHPVDMNRRGRIEAEIETLNNHVNVVVGLSERIHGTLLGFDPSSGGTVEGKAAVPAGIMAQQLEALQYLTSRVLDARHRLENIAAEIGA